MSMSVDFVHFFIIFSTIFLPFVLTGHILFGSDFPEFASLTASVSTGFSVMMGEYAWYAEEPLSHISAQTTSGKLVFFLALWYFIYMVLVVQVLLNMILAIILAKYLDVATGLHHQIDAPPIWKQVQQYREYKRITRKFVPLKEILLMLEIDDDPAHPQQVVCAQSLMKATPAWVCQSLTAHASDSAMDTWGSFVVYGTHRGVACRAV